MNFPGSFPTLYRNDGGGKFSDVSESAGIRVTNKATGMALAKSLGVSPVDLDNDGWLDLVVANDTVQNFVFHNNRNGTFTEEGSRSGVAFDRFGSTRGAMGIDTARISDNDTLAISIGNFANEMTALYVQQDPLFFTDQALDQGIELGHHHPGMAADRLRLADRQVELGAAEVDPHVLEPGHQIRVARETHTGDVEERRGLLIGNREIEMLQTHRVAEVFRAAVVHAVHCPLLMPG
jgi:hypothetical protein